MAKGNEKEKRRGFLAYLIGVRQELKKVVWPTKEELAANTVIVFFVCIFFALLFWGIDTGFLALLQKALGVSLGGSLS